MSTNRHELETIRAAIAQANEFREKCQLACMHVEEAVNLLQPGREAGVPIDTIVDALLSARAELKEWGFGPVTGLVHSGGGDL